MNFALKTLMTRSEKRNWAIAIAGASALGIVIGCGGGGGGGGGGSNKIITGSNSEIALGVADSKAMAMSAVPLMLLSQLSPSGAFLKVSSRPKTLTFLKSLQLYVSSLSNGKTLTLNFYSDSAGKSSAGSVVATSNETLGLNYTYPLNFSLAGTVSGGTVPFKVSSTGATPFLSFSDSKGANTMNGEFSLTKDQITFDLASLTANDQGNIGAAGSIKVTYNYSALGQAIPTVTTLTALTGSPVTTISGTAAVSIYENGPTRDPTMGTGAGTIDLVHGLFTLNITQGGASGLIATLNEFQGKTGTSLTMATSEGLQQVLDDPSLFNIGGLATSSGSTTTTGATTGTTSGTTGGTYQTPIAISGIQGESSHSVEQALPDGEMVGTSLDQYGVPQALYWASPTSKPIPLPTPTGYIYSSAHGIAAYASTIVIVGSSDNNHGVVQPTEWIANAGTTSFGAYDPDSGINGISDPKGGEFEGISANGNAFVGYTLDATNVQHPFYYDPMNSIQYVLKGDGRTSNLRAIAVDNYNDVLGAGDGATPTPGTWIAVKGSSGQVTAPFQTLASTNGTNYGSLQAYHMSSTGVIAGADASKAYYWSRSDNYAPHALPLGAFIAGGAIGVNDAGTLFAGSVQASTSSAPDLGFWAGATIKPVDVSSAIKNGSSYKDLAGFFILKDRSLICADVTGTSPLETTNYLYVQLK